MADISKLSRDAMFKLFIVEKVFSNDRRVLSNIGCRLNMMEIKANTWSLGLWKKIKMKNKKKKWNLVVEVESCPGRDTLAALKLIAIDRRSPLVQRIHDGEYQRDRKWAEVLKFSPLCFIYFFSSILFYFPFPSISSFFQSITCPSLLIYFLFRFIVVFIVSDSFQFESSSCLGRIKLILFCLKPTVR